MHFFHPKPGSSSFLKDNKIRSKFVKLVYPGYRISRRNYLVLIGTELVCHHRMKADWLKPDTQYLEQPDIRPSLAWHGGEVQPYLSDVQPTGPPASITGIKRSLTYASNTGLATA